MHKSKVFVMSLVFMLLMSMSMGMGVLADNHEGDDIVDTAVAADDFNTLVAAVQAADLVDALKAEGPFTVFAPTDEAFANLLDELGVTADELLASEDLTDILLYHVVEGKVMSTDLVDGMEATTLNGEKITITLNPVQVNGVNVVTPDVEASNGVIHVIDAVLLPASNEEAAEEDGTEEEATEEETSLVDIVETAAAAGSFETLLAAAQAAGLVDALKGEGPLTVFAPTDEAFAALLDELGVTAEELLANEDLADILLYHVVEGKVMSTDLVDGMEATTLNGEKVKITLNPVQVNDANVVTADVEASNGVIHVIDAVLLPGGDTDNGTNEGTAEAGDATPAIPQTSNNSVLIYIVLAALAGAVALFFIRKEKSARV
ncbi:fasciclin domain-containing protein [Alkalihalobacterium chitinilyticum]|uniref:Fasciclin domain-containing protein n=1 Tax=Alkalihalobacterium chitinilyticum TaxID=2980103 RepID=A0ABT5VCT7_9BACI|nr:fasciclin domain-containing protein [Alkalihalobacterium chitinilyticum]MDE5412542.1 fasciclin domain-containing protein [Alkalihalobacterium chitinilyticum]